MRLSDYGLTQDDVRTIKRYCSENPDFKECVMNIAVSVNIQIADALTESICEGKSYNNVIVYISENDFYGYRRKCFAVIKKMMVENGIWEREAG